MNLKQFTYLNYATPLHWNVSHNGHTVVISPISHAEKISIKGSDFDQEYDFLQFHFHWGFNDYHGSEHYIDSDKFPLEVFQIY
jgi:carbonic anhydrase